MADPTLLPDPTCLHLLQLEAEGKAITATVTTTATSARCPLCASRSEKVHSRYRGLRLVGTGSRNRKQDKWAIGDAKKLSGHRFSGFSGG
jgi:hypothetical protein